MNRLLIPLCVFAALTMVFSGCAKKQTTPQEEIVKPELTVEKPITTPEEKKPEVKIDFSTVYFGFDSYSIEEASVSLLTEAAKLLRSYPQVSVRLEGHCDERGTTEYNLALGEKRSVAVRDYLVNLGVERSRLATVSFGKEKPADLGHNEISWAKNRRVEFVIEKK
ncbi:MAG: peptidoglycan-associated lipoprotein Pal [Candidatus Edwardsbacteria bacterium]|nr:peptidoglycan-associated lipoprotein Pal [Candidatus Edwardsbacteria bacterium]MBU1575802.1 peptidoglycan-associated lipoprotein Pal [Candidatus Edwardsbacteria bacterium]MBU2463981.1 peptidoglycan-associated lipoprotein Pal [Candidatus Edwardsbacteria bacterium]MBU2593263.1 peptidoglycan-associated lipoprotein Pal [Candidatus Edwardsbacteria bacterium]